MKLHTFVKHIQTMCPAYREKILFLALRMIQQVLPLDCKDLDKIDWQTSIEKYKHHISTRVRKF